MKTNHTANIIYALEQIRDNEKMKGETYRVIAYNKAIKSIENLQKPICTIDDIAGIFGIGEKIRAKIEEIINTGTLHQLNTINKDIDIFKVFNDIHGIGPVKARELIDKHKITSLDELRNNKDIVLNDIQRKGLKYYDDFLKRIQREEMEKHEAYLLNVINIIQKQRDIHENIKATITGSYRRNMATSGDIDILITGCSQETFAIIVDTYIKDGYITDIFARGPKKVLAVCKLKKRKYHRRIDIMLTSEKEYPFALLYFTGNGPFNVAMRNIALSKGYSLSEHGLRYNEGENEGKFIENTITSEEDIFAFLNIPYIPPENRDASALLTYR